MDIYIDSETLRTVDKAIKDMLMMEQTAPANYVDPEKIAVKKQEGFEKAWAKTSLSGDFGTIACICWAAEEAAVRVHSIDDYQDEGELLTDFFTELVEILSQPHGNRGSRIVGNNLHAGFHVIGNMLFSTPVVHGIFRHKIGSEPGSKLPG